VLGGSYCRPHTIRQYRRAGRYPICCCQSGSVCSGPQRHEGITGAETTGTESQTLELQGGISPIYGPIFNAPVLYAVLPGRAELPIVVAHGLMRIVPVSFSTREERSGKIMSSDTSNSWRSGIAVEGGREKGGVESSVSACRPAHALPTKNPPRPPRGRK